MCAQQIITLLDIELYRQQVAQQTLRSGVKQADTASTPRV